MRFEWIYKTFLLKSIIDPMFGNNIKTKFESISEINSMYSKKINDLWKVLHKMLVKVWFIELL